MVSKYKPFMIKDFRSGQVNAREPWLIPEDAFVEITNGFIKNGVLQKRLGYAFFGSMVHFVPTEVVSDTGQSASHTLANIPARADKAGSVVISDDSGPPKVLTDDGLGGFTGDDNGSTIDYETGVIAIEWDAVPTSPINVAYSYIPGLPIMDIAPYFTTAGSSTLLAFDTKRVAKWDPVNAEFDDIAISPITSLPADRFTGSDSDYFHSTNWNGIMYFTNNINQLDSYNGSTLAEVIVNLGAGNIDFTCLLVFAYKDHLITFRTTEGGTLHGQRARWATAGSVDFTNDGFVDAPTSDLITGGAFLGDELVMFFERSIWILQFSQDVNLPFKWEKIDSFNGISATNSVVPFPSQIDAVSPTKIISTNGLNTRIENLKLPDVVQTFNQEAFDRIYSIFLDELDLELISYPAIESEFNDNMIVHNKFNDAWSQFNIGFHSFGKWIVDEDLAWDDFNEEIWDELEQTWDADTTQAGFPIVLAGEASGGTVFKLNDTGADNAQPISFLARTKRLNPYIDEGFSARLGWVDFLFTVDVSTTIDVTLFLDEDASPYKTVTITFEGAPGIKVWKRVYSGVISDFHEIELTNNAVAETPLIHAIVPYFLPVEGKLG
jgi:hypothetical protein